MEFVIVVLAIIYVIASRTIMGEVFAGKTFETWILLWCFSPFILPFYLLWKLIK
jgi:hypothetical protein